MADRPVLTGPLRPYAERGYVPVPLAAAVVRRPERTVRTWATTGQVRTQRHRQHVLVHWYDLLKVSETRPRRLRATRTPIV